MGKQDPAVLGLIIVIIIIIVVVIFQKWVDAEHFQTRKYSFGDHVLKVGMH